MGMQRKKSLPGVQYAIGGISLFVFLSPCEADRSRAAIPLDIPAVKSYRTLFYGDSAHRGK